MVHSLQALSKSGCWDARHESSLTNPVQKRFVRLSHRTLNMGSSCFGDGVHFEQILSRRAELCVSVWSIVCRHCQNQGAGMQDKKVP